VGGFIQKGLLIVTDGQLALLTGPRRAGRPRKMSVSIQYAESLRGADHLREADRALMELGRRLAHAIDATDDDKTLGALSGQFVAVVDRLGLSPKARRSLDLDRDTEAVNPFDAVRHLFESDDTDTDPA
jgi:hypothetical protein